MTTRETSREAFKALVESGEMSRQEARVYSAVAASKKPLTLREIQSVTGIDINAVSGRAKGLKDRGYLVECHRRRCSITGRSVIPVAVYGRAER